MQFFQYCKPIHFRHENIENDGLGRPGVDGLPAFSSALRQRGFVMTVLGQDLFDQTQIVRIIVDDQHFSDVAILVQLIDGLDEVLFENGFHQII
jgi:hypothetical protein